MEFWELGHGGLSGVHCVILPSEDLPLDSSISLRAGARGMPEVAQEGLSLGVTEEALGIGSGEGPLGCNHCSQQTELDSPTQAAKASAWPLGGLWAHAGTQLPLRFPSCPPPHAHCPPARSAISFGFDACYLSPPPDRHHPHAPTKHHGS